MPGRDAILRGGTAALAAAALTFAGCGGGGERQDADDETATYAVEIVDASFPLRQDLADETELRIVVKNVDDRAIPNLAATLEDDGAETETVAFGARSGDAGLSSRSRPVWIVDDGPRSGDSSYANTWSVGPVAPGREAELVWRVTAIRAGRYDVRWRLTGSLGGGARLETQGGDGAPRGGFEVEISRKPGQAYVAADGSILRVPGRYADRPRTPPPASAQPADTAR